MFGINGLNIEDIRVLADIIKEKELGSISVKNKDISITVKAKHTEIITSVPSVSAPVQAVPVTTETIDKKETFDGNVVKSPVVGTFYSAPAPGKPPFIEVGKYVHKGDVLMIIESMKLMNEIQSEYDGVVEKILVADGEAVEYDQPLVVIK